MKFAAGLTATGILTWLLLEALKIVMVPVTAWVLAMLALALKVALVGVGLGAAVGIGVFLVRRARRAESASA